VPFHFLLALDAHRTIRQGIEAGDWNLSLAAFARAVRSPFHAGQGALNLGQLTRFQLGQLGSDLIAAGVESGVGGIAGEITAYVTPEVFQFAGENFAESVPPAHQPLV